MPIARQRGICQASNAFNVARFVSTIFLDAPRGHRQRCFSSKTTLYTAADCTFKDEAEQRVQQVRYVFEEGSAPAVSFEPIKARAARRTLARQSIDAKLQASLDPTSLEKTLEKHRAVNMGALVRRVPIDKNAGDFKRPKTIARRILRRKLKQNNTHEEGFEENELLRDAWFDHLDVSTVPKASSKVAKDEEINTNPQDKADKIIRSKLMRGRNGSVLEYEGQYVNPISNAKLDNVQLPWTVAVDEAATTRERYDQARFMSLHRPF